MTLLILHLLSAYKKWISPLLGRRCRFYPSCSEYAYACFESRSFWEASKRTGWRLLKCNPLHPGGVDLP